MIHMRPTEGLWMRIGLKQPATGNPKSGANRPTVSLAKCSGSSPHRTPAVAGEEPNAPEVVQAASSIGWVRLPARSTVRSSEWHHGDAWSARRGADRLMRADRGAEVGGPVGFRSWTVSNLVQGCLWRDRPKRDDVHAAEGPTAPLHGHDGDEQRPR